MQQSWKKHFFGWHEDEGNIAEIPNKFVLTQEEIFLKQTYNLSDNQLSWRKNKIATMKNPDLFPQEFPITDTEAFLMSGRSRFNMNRLKLYSLQCKQPANRGYLTRKVNQLIFTPDNNGWLKTYSPPIENKKYIAGCDVAEGIGDDYSTITIFDFDRNIVATGKTKIDPAQYGRELAIVGQYYNYCHLCVESNNHGLTTLTVLKEQENYPNLHYSVTVDKATNEKTKRIGFQTNTVTKELIIDELYQVIENGSINIPCKDIIFELMSFIITDTGKSQAQSGSNDDLVISTAIGNHCIKYYRYLNNDNMDNQFQFNSRKRGY